MKEYQQIIKQPKKSVYRVTEWIGKSSDDAKEYLTNTAKIECVEKFFDDMIRWVQHTELNNYIKEFSPSFIRAEGNPEFYSGENFGESCTQYRTHYFCGNSYGKYGKSSNCNMTCSGDVE